MNRVSLSLVFLLMVSLPSYAGTGAPAPVLTSVQPAAGPIEGGTFVTITGSNLTLPPNFACVLPCPATVRFGSAEVKALEERDTYITVQTPPHAAGTVDVTVRTGDNRTTTAANAFTYVLTREQGYTTFLVPIYTDGDVPGAHGSLWRSEFWVRNNGSTSVLLAPWECPINSACPAVFPQTRELRATETLRNLPVFFRPPTANPGRLLFVTRDNAQHVTPSLRLRDLSRQAVDAGTEIPVIHESDLLTTTTQLMSVPLNGAFRIMLRVYDVTNSEARFRVRVFGQEEGVGNSSPLSETELVAKTSDTGPFRVEPAYAQLSGIEGLLSSPIPRPAQLRIQVEPLTPGSLFWAFVAITNNDTQRLTLVTPNR